MKMGLSDVEGRVLHGLVEEASGDIVLRLDANGFIVFASENVAEIGLDLSGLLVMPHIADLAEADHKSALSDFTHSVFRGDAPRGWFEFPILACSPEDECGAAECRRWYALSLRRIEGDGGETHGALGLLRSIQHKRSLEGELHSRAVTDPLTGLANRHAFCASLRRHLAHGGGEMIAIFAVDRMRALFLQFGQRTADEIMWGFAKFLETMMLPGQEIAQIDNERLAVILPDMSPRTAREWAQDVLSTFSSLTLPSSSRAPQLTASAGLARVECTVDWTLRQAELALVMARAGGGMQVGHCGRQGGAGYGGYYTGQPPANATGEVDEVGVAARAR
ncbi:GGDEF domain-containing protein [Erythrobacter sp. THAF29]|uniref:GGDEF domain-containing protein n=1 Tax=Erythrobacter sp. THAF29 TaxID=2587851 RepID=UPI0012688A2A|nr:GGDEF domain-containing protein [Erythrobacter sp. THAF29]QFT76025.1 putative diguanylate cyclase YdaM [Erythrobacter sp. THAF29]